jgi:hypothetical protein
LHGLTSISNDISFRAMANNILAKVSASHLRRVIAIKERMEKLEKELTGLLGIPEPMTLGSVVRRRRRMSASARAKISAAAKARWGKVKAKKD